MKLRYSRGALADLKAIFSYIAQDNARAAAAFVVRIEETSALLAKRPLIGRETRKSNFRRWPIGNYLIVYEITENEVIIQYVRHGARLRPWEGEPEP